MPPCPRGLYVSDPAGNFIVTLAAVDNIIAGGTRQGVVVVAAGQSLISVAFGTVATTGLARLAILVRTLAGTGFAFVDTIGIVAVAVVAVVLRSTLALVVATVDALAGTGNNEFCILFDRDALAY